MKTIITLEVEDGNVKVLSTEVVEEEVVFEEELQPEPELSVYGRRFDMENSRAWTNDAGYNAMLVCEMNTRANDMLRNQGYLFLNDVYDMLGFPKSKVGHIVGWIYDPDADPLDNYVDFGINMSCNKKLFVDQCSTDAWLDFNVDGEILDRIDSFE